MIVCYLFVWVGILIRRLSGIVGNIMLNKEHSFEITYSPLVTSFTNLMWHSMPRSEHQDLVHLIDDSECNS